MIIAQSPYPFGGICHRLTAVNRWQAEGYYGMMIVNETLSASAPAR